jgi:acyl carrier protein
MLGERVVTDIAAEVRDILVFHLGAEEGQLAADARLAEDLGADRLDLVEIAMSCEERFDIDIPNHIATTLATVGDAVRFIQAQVAGTKGAGPAPARPRLELLLGEALHACARLALRQRGRGVAMRIILMLAVAGLVTFVLQPAGAAAETGYAAFTANAAKTSSIAFIWLPAAEDGTRIGVCTPAARQAATPSRTFAAGPNNVLSASHLSERHFATSSRRPSATAVSIASISST